MSVKFAVPRVEKPIKIGSVLRAPLARLVPGGKKHMMYHESVTNPEGSTPYKTIGCRNTDDSGHCMGHPMNQKDFIEQFCGGVDPV